MHQQSTIVDGALRVWFVLTALSTAYVVVDAMRRNPELKVMRWGWVLVTLYTGPVGAAVYVLSCQEPSPGTHERFITPLWKQSLGSTIHCLAGDATGIVVAAAVTAALGLNMGVDVVVEYLSGFMFGLLVFQALFMRGMLGGSYTRAVRRSFLPEWISMNAVMAGMIPVMVILMTRHMSAMEPSSVRFWGVMSLATLAGAVVAYPFNVWLVAANLKHGMGTERVLGEGGHAVHAEAIAERASDSTAAGPPLANAPDAMSAMNAMGDRAIDAPAATLPEGPGSKAAEAMPAMRMSAAATRPQIIAVTTLSILALASGVLVGALYGELTVARGMTSPDAMPAAMPAAMPMPRAAP